MPVIAGNSGNKRTTEIRSNGQQNKPVLAPSVRLNGH